MMRKGWILGVVGLTLLAGCIGGGGREETRARDSGGRLSRSTEAAATTARVRNETEPTAAEGDSGDLDYVYREWPKRLSKLSVNLVPYWSEDDAAASMWRQLVMVDEGKYPSLMAGLDRFNRDGLMSDNDTVVIYGDQKEETVDSFYADITLLRTDEAVFSFLEERTAGMYSEAGYDETFSSREAFNLDTQTGKVLTLGDLFTDVASMEEKLLAALRALPESKDFVSGWEERVSDLLSDDQFSGSSVVSYSMDNLGFRLYFHGDVLYGEEGKYTECFLSAMELSDAMNSKYYPDAGAFAASYREDQTIYLPLEDGVHQVELYSDRDEYGYRKNLIILYDGKEFPIGDYWESYYDSEVTLFRTEGGSYYLYLTFFSDSDYRSMFVIDLKEHKPRDIYAKDGFLTGEGFDFEPEAPYSSPYFYGAVTDPLDVCYNRRFDIFGTYTADIKARVGENGDLELLDSFYYLDRHDFYGRHPLTLLRELTVEQVDREGNVIGTETLPAGTDLYLFRTNGSDSADFSTENETFYRMYYDSEDRFTIDGVDIFEIFDGLMFAG